MSQVRTTCPYCGVGCGVLATPDGTGGVVIAGDPDHPSNFGRLCSKGSALGETLGDDDGCEAARAMGESIVGCDEMQAIKAVVRHLAARQATEAQAPTVDVLRLLGLPEIVVDWVLS